MTTSKIPLKENVAITHIRNGKVLSHKVISNLVTTAGKEASANRLGGLLSTPAWTYIALGTGSAAPAISDTALGSEITTGGGARASATVSLTTTDTTNDTLRLEKLFTFSGTFTVSETAVFNNSSGATMLNRALIGPYTVISGDTLIVVHLFDLD